MTSSDSDSPASEEPTQDSPPETLLEIIPTTPSDLTFGGALTYTALFLLFTSVFLTMYTGFSCTSEILEMAMSFSLEVPEDGSMADVLQSEFSACVVEKSVNPLMLFASAGSAGFLTLTVYVWFNLDVPLRDLIGF